MSAAPSYANGRVTRQDVEAKLRELRGGVDSATESAKGVAMGVVVAAAVGFVAVAYLWGRRRGRKQSTVVEVRRV